MTIGLAIILCIVSFILGIIVGTGVGIAAICLMSVAGNVDKAMGAK